jgi:hypothetical protein
VVFGNVSRDRELLNIIAARLFYRTLGLLLLFLV